MASPFQQQARTRKFLYLGLILALFAVSFFFRKNYVEAKAETLGVREQSRGDVELTGSLVRLTLTGSRGLATSVLWSTALDKQKKNQWNELEVIVRTLTKLQPHFITPWQFQSWNLAYNVSVESDRVADKFFYVTRGVLLLGEGERQNQHQPDLRFFMGFYNQNKVYLSDETNVVRSLFQLSMIPPNERDPARFQKLSDDGKVSINWEEFQKFCEQHPQLVRRLRDGIRRDTRRDLRRQFTCERVEDVLQFLADNYRLPCKFIDAPQAAVGAWKEDRDSRRVKELSERYPPLPPNRQGQVPWPQQPWDPGGRELTVESPLDDSHDVHAISRAWYGYAQEPIPAPGEYPGENSPIVDRTRQRRPKQMTTLIFRHYPARAQSYSAERLQQEGWFDDEGYAIPTWFDRREDRPGSRSDPVVVGNQTRWTAEAWEQAANLWREHGQRNKLLFRSDADERNTLELAEKFYESEFAKERKLRRGSSPPDVREETLRAYDPELPEQFRAAKFSWEFGFYRSISNFWHHYVKAIAEARAETIAARKHFYKAERLRLAGSPEQALEMYLMPEALPAWRDQVLLKNKDFRRDNNTREDSAEVYLAFLGLFNEQYGRQLKQRLAERFALLALAGQIGQAGVRPVLVPEWYPLLVLTRANPFPKLPEVAYGPLDLVDEDNVPLIPPDTFRLVADRSIEARTGRTESEEAKRMPARRMLTLDGKPAVVKETSVTPPPSGEGPVSTPPPGLAPPPAGN